MVSIKVQNRNQKSGQSVRTPKNVSKINLPCNALQTELPFPFPLSVPPPPLSVHRPVEPLPGLQRLVAHVGFLAPTI